MPTDPLICPECRDSRNVFFMRFVSPGLVEVKCIKCRVRFHVTDLERCASYRAPRLSQDRPELETTQMPIANASPIPSHAAPDSPAVLE